MTLKTLHGAFEFQVQKYQLEGVSLSYLELTQPETRPNLGRGLQEFCAYYSNRLSYREVSELVERQCGTRVFSSQGIWQLVQQQALQLSDGIERSIVAQPSKPMLEVATKVELYDEPSAEVILYDDAIGVKAQKPQRPRRDAAATEEPEHPKTVVTDVVVLQTAPEQFEYLSAPMAADGSVRLPIETVVLSRMQQVYGQSETPLPLVVISDGATVIRNRWNRTFSSAVVVILDWYHLCEKVRQLMSMIAQSKTEKTTHLKLLLSDLWHGRTQAALDYLQQVVPRNREKWQELITYLKKHQHEIVDYEQRRQVGKSIGSGRVEKAVDQVIGSRQKRKGKSWRPQGSHALGLLKVLELNGKWQKYWFPQSAIV
ncbi:hypothetical protein [Myxacorys almedinensis]|uniref:Uncharacterized protein n=1 Tax=Myxacorys almedinensis A TaxID=2690445 RepID=A0A8J7Z8P7_9CYAN|nr:hypothetical protein [Myxacorys almedinensis]NDJ19991.1 hypothetical protein [Myxacorys almedinensis A]